jgi:hypothetical protein
MTFGKLDESLLSKEYEENSPEDYILNSMTNFDIHLEFLLREHITKSMFICWLLVSLFVNFLLYIAFYGRFEFGLQLSLSSIGILFVLPISSSINSKRDLINVSNNLYALKNKFFNQSTNREVSLSSIKIMNTNNIKEELFYRINIS